VNHVREKFKSAASIREFVLGTATPWARFVNHFSERQLKQQWLPTISFFANLTERHAAPSGNGLRALPGAMPLPHTLTKFCRA
jgi:hypothetical protein